MCEELIERLEEICKETGVKIMINGEIIDKFQTEEGKKNDQ